MSGEVLKAAHRAFGYVFPTNEDQTISSFLKWTIVATSAFSMTYFGYRVALFGAASLTSRNIQIITASCSYLTAAVLHRIFTPKKRDLPPPPTPPASAAENRPPQGSPHVEESAPVAASPGGEPSPQHSSPPVVLHQQEPAPASVAAPIPNAAAVYIPPAPPKPPSKSPLLVTLTQWKEFLGKSFSEFESITQSEEAYYLRKKSDPEESWIVRGYAALKALANPEDFDTPEKFRDYFTQELTGCLEQLRFDPNTQTLKPQHAIRGKINSQESLDSFILKNVKKLSYLYFSQFPGFSFHASAVEAWLTQARFQTIPQDLRLSNFVFAKQRLNQMIFHSNSQALEAQVCQYWQNNTSFPCLGINPVFDGNAPWKIGDLTIAGTRTNLLRHPTVAIPPVVGIGSSSQSLFSYFFSSQPVIENVKINPIYLAFLEKAKEKGQRVLYFSVQTIDNYERPGLDQILELARMFDHIDVITIPYDCGYFDHPRTHYETRFYEPAPLGNFTSQHMEDNLVGMYKQKTLVLYSDRLNDLLSEENIRDLFQKTLRFFSLENEAQIDMSWQTTLASTFYTFLQLDLLRKTKATFTNISALTDHDPASSLYEVLIMMSFIAKDLEDDTSCLKDLLLLSAFSSKSGEAITLGNGSKTTLLNNRHPIALDFIQSYVSLSADQKIKAKQVLAEFGIDGMEIQKERLPIHRTVFEKGSSYIPKIKKYQQSTFTKELLNENPAINESILKFLTQVNITSKQFAKMLGRNNDFLADASFDIQSANNIFPWCLQISNDPLAKMQELVEELLYDNAQNITIIPWKDTPTLRSNGPSTLIVSRNYLVKQGQDVLAKWEVSATIKQNGTLFNIQTIE